nr:hypothetical protein [Tanacetum cinerariifolium]
DYKDRLKLWDNLNNHKDLVKNRPWSMLGDFNAIMNAYEHSKGVVEMYKGVNEFRNYMENLDIEDLAMFGMFFTWLQKMRNPKKGILKKLDRIIGMKRPLRYLNKKNGNVHDKVKILREDLKKVQAELDKDPKNYKLKEDEMFLNNAYREAALDEEKVLIQKSKVNLLKEGDHNTAFFQNMMKGRKNKSRIVCVKDYMGNEFYDEEVANK